MKHFSTRSVSATLALVAALAFTTVAKAGPISALGTLSGATAYSSTGVVTSTTFTAGQYTETNVSNGAFSVFASTPSNNVFLNFLSPFTFSAVNTITPGQELFTVTAPGVGGATLAFYVTDITSIVAASASSTGSFYALGYVTMDGYATTTNVGFYLTESGPLTGSATSTSYSFELDSPSGLTPEPASLPLLGTGLLAMGALLFARKRSIV